MTGSDYERYTLARRVLLDALDALAEQRDALILVGAQAIYLHTGALELAVAAATFDADLAIDPALLKSAPALADALQAAGFSPRDQPGIWESSRNGIEVDLLVPASVAGTGRRGADLGGAHGKRAARKARGLEAALVDHAPMVITALDDIDPHRAEMLVAGPAALLVAKLHKVAERIEDPRRQKPKDTLDIYRLLMVSSPETLSERLAALRLDARSALVTAEALGYLRELFGTGAQRGSQLAGIAVVPLDDPDTVAESVAALAQDLLALL